MGSAQYDTSQRDFRYHLEIENDTLRALILFTQFKDDLYPGDPAVNRRAWPLPAPDETPTLPPFARYLLASSPHPPYPDSSLTAYFHTQSLGRLVLYGSVYDSVLVSTHPEAYYHRPTGGYGDLTKELLDRLDASGFDFSPYDANHDGRLDHVFIILRGDSQRDARRFNWTGASCLDGRCSGSMVAGGPNPGEPVYYDGKRLDWNLSGSYLIHRTPGNIDPLTYHVRLMAHEIGHDLWAEHFVHVPANPRNDVPLAHNRGGRIDCIGYMLMAGAGGAQDCGGSQTISAYERELLGWIDCPVLESVQTNLRIGDLYSTSGCYKILLDGTADGRRLYVTNLQRIGFFDRYRRSGAGNRFELGLLRTTGMLAMLVDGSGVDILPADNSLHLATDNTAYDGDLFSPSGRIQLTPWTRPNSNGYNTYPRNHAPVWAAIDRIRYDDAHSGALVFDFYPDFRVRPIIREDSWMGALLDGYTFEQGVEITNLSTLHLETSIAIEGALNIQSGSRLHIAPNGVLHVKSGSTLRLAHGSAIDLEGILVLDGIMNRAAFSQLNIQGNGRIQSHLPR